MNEQNHIHAILKIISQTSVDALDEDHIKIFEDDTL